MRTKFVLVQPNSHDERTTQPCVTACSASSFVRPVDRARRGRVGLTYGSRFVPSKT
ncbi:MAG: hypothetical protein R3C15_11660 [Thermoleophilia bacterium]